VAVIEPKATLTVYDANGKLLWTTPGVSGVLRGWIDGNSVVVQSDDPRELMTHLAALGSRPELGLRIRAEGKATAKRYVWPRMLDAMEASWEAAAALG